MIPVRLPRDPTRLTSAIREIVFGIEDGSVQNMTLVAGLVGVTAGRTVLVVAGVINAVAGVLSMSMGTYLSSKAEQDIGPAHEDDSPVRDAAVMAAAYAGGALVPLTPFLLGVPAHRGAAVALALGLTLATLYGLGVLTARLGGKPAIRGGLELMGLAAGAGVAGYLVGATARAVFGVEV